MKLVVLMWKLWISRYKRYFQTAMEILNFVILFYFLHWLNGEVRKDVKKKTEAIITNTEVIRYSDFDFPSQVVYYPQTNASDILMNLAAEKMNLKRLKKFPKYGKAGLYGSDDLSKIQDYMEIMASKTAAVVFFHYVDPKELPEKLKYTIRIKSPDFNIHDYHANDEYLSHSNLGQMYEPFMKIQWAIDTSYIEIKKRMEIKKKLSVQEFPNAQEPTVEVDKESLLQSFTQLFTMLSLSLTFMFHVGRIVEDRISGVQALLSMSGVSSFILNLSHFLNAFAAGIIYSVIGIFFYTIKDSKSSRAVIEYSEAYLVWLMFLMYFCSIIMFGFVVAFALPNKSLVVPSGALVYIVSSLTLLFAPQDPSDMNNFFMFLAGLLPHLPLSWYLKHFFGLEKSGRGLTSRTLFEKNKGMNMTPFYAYQMIGIQIVLFAIVGLYLSLVKPGKYVTPMPLTFLCMKNFWRKKVAPNVETTETIEPLHKKKQYYEQLPPSSQIGIQVVDVTKMYNNNRVLNKLSLNVYQGEITVLLGHNGAGKTTILSIIAGMNQATSGRVFVDGLDTALQTKKVINSIGVCPQENMFFTDLSVVQHLIFFTMLRKSVGFAKARQSSLNLLKQLGLYHKRATKVTKLSGGMMRRVQLGCALAGDSRILILDEPTSGLDVETRRELWDLLLTLRGERTVLLTTHFMEEADVLGDRVAALHGGELRCHASPDYLKKAVGKGYLLNLVTIGVPMTKEITDAVHSEVPEAVFKEATLNSITFVIPPEATNKFPKMFHKLEDNRDQLSINSIGVGTATLEEVFLTLCSDVDTKFTKDNVDEVEKDVVYHRITGFKLYLIQFITLFLRQMKYIKVNKFLFVFMRIVGPIALVVLMLYTKKSNSQPKEVKASASMDLSLYDDMPHKKILLDIEDPYLKLLEPKFTSGHKRVQFIDTKDIAHVTFRKSLKNRQEFKNYILGLKINKTHAQVLYSTSVRHAAPVALNMLTNMLAGEPETIHVENMPVFTFNQSLQQNLNTRVKTREEVTDMIVYIAVVFGIYAAMATYPLTTEHVTGTRHIFIMYGCSPALYWIFTMLYNLVVATLTFFIPTVLLIMAFEEEKTLDEPMYLWALFVLLVVGAIPIMAVCFLLSLRYKEMGFVVLLAIFDIIFLWICPLILFFQNLLGKKNVYNRILKFLSKVIPFFTFSNALIDAGSLAVKNANCRILRKFICKIVLVKPDSIKKCCSTAGNEKCFFCFDDDGLGKQFVLLIVQAVICMILVLLTQFGILRILWGKLRNIRFNPPAAKSVDPLATEEINYVNNAMNLPPSKVTDALIMHNLYKVYLNIFAKKIVAVRGVSLSVKKGECFGLVGVNGAGKTSMFNMLVGASHITRGAVLCRGHRGSTIPGKYMRELGFCPQHHSLDDFQTGQENLTMLLKFRGFRTNDIRKEVDFWINLVSLQQHRHKPMAAYSGGCKRRLAAAAALMSGGALTVLDEPTTGVDVSARRALWIALRGGLRGNRAVVVSSHSMEEIEALCGRVCILVAGQVRALAAPAELRRLHATGHSLHFNLAPDESVATEERVNKLKEDVQQTFDCTLKDAHKSMLHYRIATTLQYSDLFTAVEQLKARHSPLLADYTVKQPTLEDVFLAFAREGQAQQEQRNASGKNKPPKK